MKYSPKALGYGLSVLTAMAALIGTGAPLQAQDTTPNVVFILADNVGYCDLGPYGGGELCGAPTPRIDQLAREGLRLTQFLVEPACTPSRAALMTAQYSIRNGLSLIIVPGTNATLSAHAYTMGDMFHDLGYATAIFGKWHLGSEPQSLPLNRGYWSAILARRTASSSPPILVTTSIPRTPKQTTTADRYFTLMPPWHSI